MNSMYGEDYRLLEDDSDTLRQALEIIMPKGPSRRPRRSRRLNISRPIRAAMRAVEAHETRGKQ